MILYDQRRRLFPTFLVGVMIQLGGNLGTDPELTGRIIQNIPQDELKNVETVRNI